MDLNVAAGLLYETMDHAEAKACAGAGRLSGKEGLEGAFAQPRPTCPPPCQLSIFQPFVASTVAGTRKNCDAELLQDLTLNSHSRSALPGKTRRSAFSLSAAAAREWTDDGDGPRLCRRDMLIAADGDGTRQ